MNKMKSKFLQEASINDDIFNKLGIYDNYDFLKTVHNESGRYYHNWNHIDEVILEIEKWHAIELFSDNDLKILIITALYHDIIYDPQRNDNEELSANFLYNSSDSLDLDTRNKITELIRFTKYDRNPENDLEECFACCDMSIFEKDFNSILEFEKAIQNEYAWVPLNKYIPARIEVLKKISNMHYGHTDNKILFQNGIIFLINYLKNKKWNIGIYCGSFFPFHVGHYSVLKQAEKIFDKVIILNSSESRIKSKTSFDWDIDKYGPLNPVFDNLEVHTIKQLITNDIKQFQELGNVSLIRGLRNGSDLLYEQNYLQTLQDIDPNISVVHFLTKPEHAHVSSSMVRELIQINPQLVKKYLTFD